MTSALFFFIFVLGLIIGSFLNVVIFRYNTGHTVHGRSHCFSCGTTLHWYELIPLVSFLVLRGRCRHCQSRISLQYFFVELLTASVFTLTFARLSQFGYLMPNPAPVMAFTLLYFLAMSILIVIVVYDLRHKIIPDGLVYTFTLLALLRVLAGVVLVPQPYPWFVDIVSGALLSLFFVGLWYFSHGRWMGLGDGKLVLGMSWFLPFSQNIAAILIAFWGGAIIGILLLIVSHGMKTWQRGTINLKTELPFAPFLIGALFIVFLFGIDLGNLSTFFQI